MQTTGNLGLKKPEGTDIVDIADLNGNMDILDNAVNGKVDKVTGKQLSTNDYTAAEKTKLAGIATGATNYTHPATHPPAIIVQDASNRFVTDAEKTAWNAKETPAGAQAKADAAVAAVKTDYIRQPGYAATSGTATAYSVVLAPAPTTTPDGFGITIVPHVTNGASPTLSVNGLAAAPLKDQKGVAYTAGKLLVGKPYTFRRVGTDFLADSAGGSGNAVAGDIRAGKTAATDAGDITGTLPVQTGGTVTPGATAVVKPAGIYDAAITVAAVTVPAAKVLNDTTIAGTKGTIPIANPVASTHWPAPEVSYGAYSGDGIPYLYLTAPNGHYLNGVNWVRYREPNFNPAYYRSDVNMFGQQGAMPVINDAADPATGIGIWGDGGLAVYPREGYRKGGAGAGEIKVPLDLLRTAVPLYPQYIAAGVNMFNVIGTLQPRLYAAGSGNLADYVQVSDYATNDNWGTYSLTVTGLAFKPRVVRIITGKSMYAFSVYARGINPSGINGQDGLTTMHTGSNRFVQIWTPAAPGIVWASDNGFRLPAGGNEPGLAVSWEAWG
ncbi:hypothetical protein NYE25_17795 [Paenibacillus sp. FSL E2-8871]|uniref:hypothetical protein n=1 Tax=unclassified Paenibacillus TaxID=185978 RepID=UPI0030D7689E